MLNVLRPAMTRLFTPVGKVLARTPITPNAITVIGTVGVVGGALGLFPIGELFPAPSPARSSCSSTCWTACWPG